ncbi:DNA-3-methyladenine glycosylase [Candidatus Contubernalis alkaliaceticus]|uniref:DNA-3-methyladenine glycosylase n=1 Tax=Candidatus Contubernalis alkaliaceticus TaxID=338645 RepID=UPI001F4C4516|nr:DNA-3-methyladenine glycosylase [Candidatus Contubernalis alkalaceticus]UNC92641.1 DNA-3-methyladenine glycosylase [Candidatus Contubernalis alkalaceticus]
MKKILKNFYYDNTVDVARRLLGKILVHSTSEGLLMGKIVETEAYLSRDDPACHAAKGKTKRNEVMFGPPGNAYVYLIYGMYYCFNVVTRKEGVGEAVLIRAMEPLEGIMEMLKRRGISKVENLTNGPGKLCQAMGINKLHNGISLTDSELFIMDTKANAKTFEIASSPRIGIKTGKDLLLRFYISNNPFVSSMPSVPRGRFS